MAARVKANHLQRGKIRKADPEQIEAARAFLPDPSVLRALYEQAVATSDSRAAFALDASAEAARAMLVAEVTEMAFQTDGIDRLVKEMIAAR